MAGEPDLAEGDTGSWVSYLQGMLAEQGVDPAPPVTGQFDEMTKWAVRQFRYLKGLPDSETVDETMWAALNADLFGGDGASPDGSRVPWEVTKVEIEMDQILRVGFRNTGSQSYAHNSLQAQEILTVNGQMLKDSAHVFLPSGDLGPGEDFEARLLLDSQNAGEDDDIEFKWLFPQDVGAFTLRVNLLRQGYSFELVDWGIE